jgi:hypothetical protein
LDAVSVASKCIWLSSGKEYGHKVHQSKGSREGATKSAKSVAASALSQVDRKKETSQREASTASKVLRDDRSTQAAKSAAGSVLAQRSPAKKPVAKKAAPSRGTNSGGPKVKR